jgi:carbamoyl-phosphate synthase large subunit
VLTVLVTGCGGAIGQGVVKALRKDSDGLRLIGVDSDPYAALLYLERRPFLLDKGCVVPIAEHLDYIPKILEICIKEKVDVIFPSTDHELEKLSISKDKFSEVGIKVVISPPETIRICRDKWLTYQLLGEHLPIAKSALPDIGLEKALQFTGLPAIIKPRRGWGSRQVCRVDSLEEARYLIRSVSEPMIQAWLEGQEYTIDGIVDKYGKAICLVPRRRLKVFSGVSFEGITVRDEELIELGQRMTRHLNILGPFNFQVVKNSRETRIFEINPRFAGAGILSVEAGVNIPLLAVQEICNLKILTKVDFMEGIVLSRCFDEVFFNIQEAKSHEN